MEQLLNLLLRIRSEANNLQKKKVEKNFRDSCSRLSKLANESIALWHKAETGIGNYEEERTGELLCNLWCDTLATSIMLEGGAYLRRCSWMEIQHHVGMVAAALHGVGRGYRSNDSRNQIKSLCTSLVDCCDEARREAMKPRMRLYPEPGFKPAPLRLVVSDKRKA